MVAPFHTHEVRWFAPGPVTQPVQAWFKAFGKRVVQPPRIDSYLLGIDTALNIKTREGSLEVKQRTSDHGDFTFSSNLVGRVESWVNEAQEKSWREVIEVQNPVFLEKNDNAKIIDF